MQYFNVNADSVYTEDFRVRSLIQVEHLLLDDLWLIFSTPMLILIVKMHGFSFFLLQSDGFPGMI